MTIVKRLGCLLKLLVFPLSWLLNRTVRNAFKVLYRLAFFRTRARLTGGPFRWEMLNELVLSRPMAISYLAIAAPRWNLHALIASAGPARIERRLSIDTTRLSASAARWYLVIYTAPGSRTVCCLSSDDLVDEDDSSAGETEPMRHVDLAPGVYSITLRAYDPGPHLQLPEVKIDEGTQTVPARTIEVASLKSLKDIVFNRTSPLFRLAHHYMRTMLTCRRLFPPRWTEREYLPVGNPETVFVYGAFDKGQSVCATPDAEALAGCSVYLTCYNTSSFPVFCARLGDEALSTPPLESPGFYLFRIITAHPISDPEARLGVSTR